MKTRRQIWGVPVALGVITIVGLMSALLGDGVWDAVSVVALAVPVGVICWHWFGPSKAAR